MKSFVPEAYILENTVQHYAWGSRNEEAFIARLLDLQPKPDQPFAELWMGAHPKAPSVVCVQGRKIPLQQFIERYPDEVLGPPAAQKFGSRLPFLFKVLSAGEALSIQAHPNKQQARKLHQKDAQNYPDDNHKPEIAIALDELTALVGFRQLNEIRKVLNVHPEIRRLLSPATTARLDNGRIEEKETIRAVYADIMKASLEKPDILPVVLADMERRLLSQNDRGERDHLFLDLRKKYGDDVGLFSLYLLNLLHLAKGQGVFLNAGIPHAYLKGNIIECMANSDNVVRAGLTPKFKDVTTLLEILTYEAGPVALMEADSSADIVDYSAPVEEFCVSRIQFGKQREHQIKNTTARLLLVLSGSGKIHAGRSNLSVIKGQCLLIPASAGAFNVCGERDTLLFSARIPD